MYKQFYILTIEVNNRHIEEVSDPTIIPFLQTIHILLIQVLHSEYLKNRHNNIGSSPAR